jgi:hypothetical protein
VDRWHNIIGEPTIADTEMPTAADQWALATRPTSIGIDGRLRSESDGRHHSADPPEIS